MGIYDYSVEKRNGEILSLKEYEGKVLLIVNTATGCGFTPQYEDLQKLYKNFHEKGLEILDIPCNQFAGQTPGTDDEVHEFCTLQYKTEFDQMKKAEVNGANALPLYGYLKEQKGFEGFGTGVKAMAMGAMCFAKDPKYKKNPDIKWNFTKFLVDRKGNVVQRFEPTHSMEDVKKAVEALL